MHGQPIIKGSEVMIRKLSSSQSLVLGHLGTDIVCIIISYPAINLEHVWQDILRVAANPIYPTPTVQHTLHM
jgi:hypothetical protein